MTDEDWRISGRPETLLAHLRKHRDVLRTKDGRRGGGCSSVPVACTAGPRSWPSRSPTSAGRP
jgi:hypothetical protein